MKTALTGQVGLVPGASNWVTWAICKITGSHCGHAFLYVEDGNVVSADGDWGIGRVRLRPATDFPTAIVSEYVLTPEEQDAIVAYGMGAIDKPYAYLDDALIGIERIFRIRFPRWVRARFADDGQLQCAQLCDNALDAGGVKAFDDGRSIGDVFPGSFEQDWVQKKHWYKAEYFASFPLRWSMEAPA